jgi:hypothetical protein
MLHDQLEGLAARFGGPAARWLEEETP